MNTCLFISRHAPNEAQVEFARELGYDLVHVGDVDAFDVNAVRTLLRGAVFAATGAMGGRYICDAVACVHPAIALTARAAGLAVIVFNNVNRAPLGSPPAFATTGGLLVVPSRDADIGAPDEIHPFGAR